MNLPFDCQLVCYKVGSHLVLQCVFRKSEVGEGRRFNEWKCFVTFVKL